MAIEDLVSDTSRHRWERELQQTQGHRQLNSEQYPQQQPDVLKVSRSNHATISDPNQSLLNQYLYFLSAPIINLNK